VRVIQRIHRRGLSSAATEGIMSTSAPFCAVIDGDMQHDESRIMTMLNLIKDKDLDIVVGSRNVADGSMGQFSRRRVQLSTLGRRLSSFVCRADLSDPMSGFFMVRREFFEEVVRRLSMRGFKILVDILASSRREVRFAEVGYTFRERRHGKSKLDIVVGLEYLELLLDKFFGDWIDVSYLIFVAVGSIGLIAHLGLVWFFLHQQISLTSAQIAASLLNIGINFVLNNELTFRSARLKGRSFWMSLGLFYVGCLIGLVMNWNLTMLLSSNGGKWYIASATGLVAGSIWNYWISRIWIWQVRRRRARKAGRPAELAMPVSSGIASGSVRGQ